MAETSREHETDAAGELIPFPVRPEELPPGELVDADHDGLPDTVHRDTPGELVEPAGRDVAESEAEIADGEIVDEPVDRPGREPRSAVRMAMVRKAADRRPVIPVWARSRAELRFVTTWLARHYTHIGAYHGIRVPVYVVVLAVRSPVGVVKVLVVGGRWVFDAEGHPLRVAAVQKGDGQQYLQLKRERDARVKTRLVVVFLAAGVLLVLVLVLVLAAPMWVEALAAAGGVAALGWLGAPADHPVIGPAVVVPKMQRLTSEHVIRALKSIGMDALNKKDAVISFPAPIQRDGPGWRAEVDLPYGVTATDVMERRDRLASGLRRPLGCVWPEPVHEEHTGRLVLWVGDEDMSQRPGPRWPLLKGGEVDLFKSVPFMTDQRGRPTGIDLVFTNVLVGSIPRMGKTFAVRQLVLATTLDPYARLRIFELKGTGDLGMCERVAHRYASGAGDEALDACMDSLRDVYADLLKRSKTITRIAKQDPARCPENKVTPELSRDPQLGLELEVFVIDECQELYSNKDYRDEAEKLSEGLIKRGPAMGIILILATQRPDSKSLPKTVSDNMGVRFCLRVMGQEANDMVLGTSSYKNGIRASMFRGRDKGIGYLVGATDDPMIGRTYYIDGPTADKVVDRAVALRERAGTLSGHAVGEEHRVVDVRADVLNVAAGVERLWSSVLLERLAVLRPEVYAGWGPEQLAAALRPFGGRPGQVWGTGDGGKGANRQGYVMAELSRGDGP